MPNERCAEEIKLFVNAMKNTFTPRIVGVDIINLISLIFFFHPAQEQKVKINSNVNSM